MEKPGTPCDCQNTPPTWVAANTGRKQLPPSEWNEALVRLARLTAAPRGCPALGARLETHTEPGTVLRDTVAGSSGEAGFTFHLTIAGWGQHQSIGQPPTVLTPGAAFVAVTPTCGQWSLPRNSPGWTFAQVTAQHPYLASRVDALIEACGPVLVLTPRTELAETALRLLGRALRNDFQDKFDAEFSLFGLVLTLERAATFMDHSRSRSLGRPHTTD